MDNYRAGTRQSLEVGGPGGIRINSIVPGSAEPVAMTSTRPNVGSGSPLALAARHPVAVSLALGIAALSALFGPLALILALELPYWLMVGPVVLATILLGAAIAAPRGGLSAISRAFGQPALEQRILELALRSGGCLTVPGTARELSISLADAERALMDLARAGHVDIDNDPSSGAVIYVIREVEPQLQSSAGPFGSRDESSQ